MLLPANAYKIEAALCICEIYVDSMYYIQMYNMCVCVTCISFGLCCIISWNCLQMYQISK